MSLGRNLANSLIKFRGFDKRRTQKWLADMIGVSRATVNRWEKRGAGDASLQEIETIAQKTEIPIMEVIGLVPASRRPLIQEILELDDIAFRSALPLIEGILARLQSGQRGNKDEGIK